MKHTKGKWEVRKDHDSPFLVRDRENCTAWHSNSFTIFNEAKRIVCDISYKTDSKNQGYGRINNLPEWEETAKLISKAPEMYEALKGLIRLKRLIQYKGNIPESQYDEAMAIDNLIMQVESLLKEIES